MSPAPPKGILALPISTLKSGAPALAHPSKWHGVVTLTPEEFTYGFVNTFSAEAAAAAYERYAVPETGQIFYEAGFANFHLHPPTEVYPKNGERAPLLIIGADEGQHRPGFVDEGAVDAATSRRRRRPTISSRVGRPHLHMVAPDWQEVAAAVDSWLDGVLDEPRAAGPMDLELERQGRRRHGRGASESGSRSCVRSRARRMRGRGALCTVDELGDVIDGVTASMSTWPSPAARRVSSQEAVDRHGRLDVLVNNVGGGSPCRADSSRVRRRRRRAVAAAQLLRRAAGNTRCSGADGRAGRRHDRQRRVRERVLPSRRSGHRLRRGEGGAAQRVEGALAGARPARDPDQQRLARPRRDRPVARRARSRRPRFAAAIGRRRRNGVRAEVRSQACPPAVSRPPRRSRRSMRYSRPRAPANVTGSNYLIDGGLIKTM